MFGILKELERLVPRVMLGKGSSCVAKTRAGKRLARPGSLDSHCRPPLPGRPRGRALSAVLTRQVSQVSGVKCLPSPQHTRFCRLSAQLRLIWTWLRRVSL